jgi:hypothetical protein
MHAVYSIYDTTFHLLYENNYVCIPPCQEKKRLSKKIDTYIDRSTKSTNRDGCRNFKKCKDTESLITTKA